MSTIFGITEDKMKENVLSRWKGRSNRRYLEEKYAYAPITCAVIICQRMESCCVEMST